MSDETNHGHSGKETGFEREDLSTRGVFAFMIGLAIVGVVIYFIIVDSLLIFRAFNKGTPLVSRVPNTRQKRETA